MTEEDWMSDAANNFTIAFAFTIFAIVIITFIFIAQVAIGFLVFLIPLTFIIFLFIWQQYNNRTTTHHT
ncbi:MAG: hypothetical protein MUO73_03450 [Thermoplasmata archaeon]|nr:hypothetical protein [Thermoplasmata archaeon]